MNREMGMGKQNDFCHESGLMCSATKLRVVASGAFSSAAWQKWEKFLQLSTRNYFFNKNVDL